ncbi:MAG: TetR/AcrR family transcriptional regulator [Acidobacteriota bacterium]
MKRAKIRADRPRAERESCRREDIRIAILRAAEKIITAKGYTAMNMDDVAREAGLSKAPVYKYVPSKGRILFEIVSHHLDVEGARIRAIAEAANSPTEKLRAIIAEFVGFNQAKRNIARMVMMDRSLLRFLRLIYGGNVKAAGEQARRKIAILSRKAAEISGGIVRVINEGVAAGEFRSVDTGDAVFLIDALLAGTSHPRFWEEELSDVPAEVLSGKIFDFIFSGLRRQKDES